MRYGCLWRQKAPVTKRRASLERHTARLRNPAAQTVQIHGHGFTLFLGHQKNQLGRDDVRPTLLALSRSRAGYYFFNNSNSLPRIFAIPWQGRLIGVPVGTVKDKQHHRCGQPKDNQYSVHSLTFRRNHPPKSLAKPAQIAPERRPLCYNSLHLETQCNRFKICPLHLPDSHRCRIWAGSYLIHTNPSPNPKH